MTTKINFDRENTLNNENEFKMLIDLIKHDKDMMQEAINIILKDLYENQPKLAVEILHKSGCIKNDVTKLVDNKFHGLRASVEFDLDLLNEDEDVIDIMEWILDLDVKPSRMFIKKGRIDVFYQPQKEIFIENKLGYRKLINDFIDFIESQELVEMKFLGWDLNIDKIVESQENDSDISFSKEIFNPDTVYFDGLIEGYVNL